MIPAFDPSGVNSLGSELVPKEGQHEAFVVAYRYPLSYPAAKEFICSGFALAQL